MPETLKNKMSHRYKALLEMKAFLDRQ